VKKSAGLIRPGRKTRRRKCWFMLSFSQSRRMSIDVDFFGRTEEVARWIAHSLSTKRRGGDCWGWPRLVSVSVSQHLPTTKSGGILRLCHRRKQYGYALAEGVGGKAVGGKGVIG
jgi:hypothetical protein